MAVKLVVMYPRPKDIDAFEYVYKNEHLPIALENLTGKTKIVAIKVISSPFAPPAFHRVAEVYFPSLKEPLRNVQLQRAGSSQLLMRFPSRREEPQRSSLPRKKRSCFRKT
jgi:uncharacterized protein (TIGR02118 family)